MISQSTNIHFYEQRPEVDVYSLSGGRYCLNISAQGLDLDFYFESVEDLDAFAREVELKTRIAVDTLLDAAASVA